MSAPKLMINPDLVPSPFTFNPLKHHLGFIRQLLEYAASGENEAEVINLINTIGPQLTDIYYGDFSVEYILEEIKSILLQLSCFKMESYEKWVENSGKHYNLLELSDGSKWTFRKGEKRGRYIHFHPARLSHSVRVRGTTLRTALAIKLLARGNTELYQDSGFINEIRKSHLELSPIKNIQSFTAMKKVLDLLNKSI
jgi:hypothetical protein